MIYLSRSMVAQWNVAVFFAYPRNLSVASLHTIIERISSEDLSESRRAFYTFQSEFRVRQSIGSAELQYRTINVHNCVALIIALDENEPLFREMKFARDHLAKWCNEIRPCLFCFGSVRIENRGSRFWLVSEFRRFEQYASRTIRASNISAYGKSANGLLVRTFK